MREESIGLGGREEGGIIKEKTAVAKRGLMEHGGEAPANRERKRPEEASYGAWR
jgi:hypothetical protein